MTEDEPLSLEKLNTPAKPDPKPAAKPKPASKTPAKPQTSRKRKPDSLGSYANAQPGLAHELARMTWTMRALLFSLCVTGSVCLGLISLVFVLLPLKEVEPYLMHSRSKYDLIVTTQPIPITESVKEIILENAIREYVIQRNKIYPLHEEMTIRWLKPEGFVASYSSEEVTKNFQNQVLQEIWPDIVRNPIYQDVEILRVRNFGNRQWEIEFTTVQIEQGTEKKINPRSWTAKMTIKRAGRANFEESEKTLRGRATRNPFGIQVIHYVQDEVLY